MSVLDQIEKLPLLEKLQVMEALWKDLSRHEEQVEVPQWHKTLLDNRDLLLREKSAKVIDWERAKEDIRKVIS